MIRAAYGMIVRERRRYFRCPLRVAATVGSSVTGEIRGETTDVSEDGMAIRLPYSLGLGAELVVRLKLSDSAKEMLIRAKVIRSEENGLAGLSFVEVPGPAKSQLHEWLSRRLEEQIPSLAKPHI
jgi:c-di-GMP-binding flagellar brake protein YcgR